jgi:hypothetical protein
MNNKQAQEQMKIMDDKYARELKEAERLFEMSIERIHAHYAKQRARFLKRLIASGDSVKSESAQ